MVAARLARPRARVSTLHRAPRRCPAAAQIRVGKWVDRLQKQFYGTCFAYDKALRGEVGWAARAGLGGAPGWRAAWNCPGTRPAGRLTAAPTPRRAQGGPSAQQAAFVAALLKNVYEGEPQNKPWAELLSRYLCRCGLLCGHASAAR